MSTPEVTAAVPVKDRREQMLRCLDALLAQDHPSYEIIVLDNESSDGIADAVRARAARATVPVTVEVVAGNRGRVRNVGTELARGEFIAFTDSDCVADPGWLTAATTALKADPSLGLVTGRTLPQEAILEGWPHTIRIEQFTGRYESCNIVFRTEALRGCAGFDEAFVYFMEDTVAGLEIRRAGWNATYAPDALVYHDVTYPGYWWHVKRIQNLRNMAPVVARYPELRRDLLIGRVFMSDRDARFCAALVGAAVARKRPLLGCALTLPYLHALFDPKAYAQDVVIDGARLVALLRGGLRNGRIVL